MISVYDQTVNNNLTVRDYEGMKKYLDLIQWGRKNPVQFIEKILQIPLMDYQKWLISMTWNAEYACWVCSRNIGKSFLAGVFLQTRAILFPKSKILILSAGSRQASESFTTMENIIKNNVKSLVRTNTVVADEIKKSKADSDGFTHDQKKGYSCEFLNGTTIQSVVGTPKTMVGKRANLLFYDESGIIPGELYNLTEPFASASSSFKLGSTYDAEVYPPDMPNLRLYVGSATDTNSYFYGKYKEACKQMLAGSRKYFAADLNCEVAMHPTKDGKTAGAFLSRDEVDRKMRENEVLAMREYYNIFDSFDLEDAVVTRTDIFNNTQNYFPVLRWGGKKHKYIITFDPASKVDNSPVLVTELYRNEAKEWCGRFVHMENLVVTYGDGSKRPMRIDEQVSRLRELIYEYNGKENVAPYENVIVGIDAGAGGQASAILQELTKDWTDAQGRRHPGLYDENDENMKRWAEAYPHAVAGSLISVEPRRYRNELFEATKVLVPQGVIKFPPTCPKYDTLVLDDDTEHKLSKPEMASLIQMDLMKEEMMSMVRIKSANGGITYALPAAKRNRMHDDRNYVAVMACWIVRRMREDETVGDGAAISFDCFFTDRKPSDEGNDAWSQMMRKGGRAAPMRPKSPFAGKSPFANK